jgi:AcrR family transcriptional regulator
MEEKPNVQVSIIEAARDRFKHYGYAKTTVAEIAGDCGMSPGNLYRYFPSKLDIAEALAREELAKGAAELSEESNRLGHTAAEKLRIFLQGLLERTFSAAHPDRKLFEVVHILITQRAEFADWRRNMQRQILTHIIQEGIASGEFAVNDAARAARRVQCATTKYAYPQLYTQEPLEILRAELNGVVDFLLSALSVPEGPGPCPEDMPAKKHELTSHSAAAIGG